MSHKSENKRKKLKFHSDIKSLPYVLVGFNKKRKTWWIINSHAHKKLAKKAAKYAYKVYRDYFIGEYKVEVWKDGERLKRYPKKRK